jgi:hypothetical protein
LSPIFHPQLPIVLGITDPISLSPLVPFYALYQR